MTSTETFYQASGSSPPTSSDASPDPATRPEPLPLPQELIEDLARLFADAIVADIRQYPNLSELKANRDATVESPSGRNRREVRVPRRRALEPPRETRRLAKTG